MTAPPPETGEWPAEETSTPTLVRSPRTAAATAIGTLPPSYARGRRWTCPTCRALYRDGMSHCPIDGAVLAEVVNDPWIGHTLAGRYVIEALLGEGGMGRVYRAHHARMRRRFAVKVLHAELSTRDKMVVRFQREASAISRLSHRNVVSIVDFGEAEGGVLYLVMEYVDGMSLRQVLRDEGPLSGDRALALLEQLCDGLAHAHHHGIVHRDFKPDNILIEVGEVEEARIVDFGIAADIADQRITTDGLVLGTPQYMAPEQTVGGTFDHRTDLYALGVVLYEMLAGVVPFAGLPALVAQMHVMLDPPRIADRAPGLLVDPLLEALAMRLMAKMPEDRPATAREVRRLVRLVRTNRAQAAEAIGVKAQPETSAATQPFETPTVPMVQLRRIGASHKPPPPPRRRARWPWAVAVSALAGIAVAALGGSGPSLRGVAASVAVVPTPAVAVAPTIVELPRPEVPVAAAPVAVAPVAAAPVAAAPVAAAPVVAAPVVSDRRPRATRRPLSQQYRDLGARLDRLAARRRPADTAALRARYLKLPVVEALRDPTRARAVERDLAALRREVQRLERSR
jgi:eukaryotic-like serine/threonine-protein kinase